MPENQNSKTFGYYFVCFICAAGGLLIGYPWGLMTGEQQPRQGACTCDKDTDHHTEELKELRVDLKVLRDENRDLRDEIARHGRRIGSPPGQFGAQPPAQ